MRSATSPRGGEEDLQAGKVLRLLASGLGHQRQRRAPPVARVEAERRYADFLRGQAEALLAWDLFGGWASASFRHAGRSVATVEQVAVPPRDGVGAYQQEVPHFRCREVVEQADEDRAVGVGEHGPADLAPQDEQLMPQREDSTCSLAS